MREDLVRERCHTQAEGYTVVLTFGNWMDAGDCLPQQSVPWRASFRSTS